MPIVKMSAKGQVVIPAQIRKRTGLKPAGQVLVWLDGENRVVLEPVPEDPIGAACGMLRGGPSLTKALLEERRKDDARTEKKLARLFRASGVSQRRTRFRKG